jgi:riboflavin biosynthesis pyrimidine reductase
VHHLQPGPAIVDPLQPYESAPRVPRNGPCWVLANMVGGLDGCAAVGGRVGSLSDDLDAELFRLMRAVADVVLVGAETVRREGYGPVRLSEERRLARRAAGRSSVPRMAVVTRSLDLDFDSALFADSHPSAPAIVVTCETASPERRERAADVAEVVVVGEKSVDFAGALPVLHELVGGSRSGRPTVVLCEGGPAVLGEVVTAGLLDEYCLTLSPMMGGDPLPLAVFRGQHELADFDLAHVLEHGNTLYLRYVRSEPGSPADASVGST